MSLLARLDERTPAAARSLPDFLIIGTQKGGTTSLFRYLSDHPQVAPGRKKEIRFFDKRFHRGVDWYRAHYPPRWRRHLYRATRARRLVTGEATPTYLYWPAAPVRVRAVVPNVRLVALLRDPVARAYSHYHHGVRAGREPRTFGVAVEEEIEGIERGDPPAKFAYVARGLYARQLERWWSVFPREQLQILASEDLYKDPDRVVADVCGFLGIRPPGPAGRRRRAYNRHPYERADAATWDRLTEFFRDENRTLFERLGREFAWSP